MITITPDFLKKRPLTYSSLLNFKRSPEFYVWSLTAPKKKNPAIIFDSFLDCMILTPSDVEKRFVKAPELNLKKWADKDLYEIFCQKNVDREVIPYEDYEKAEKMTKKINNNKGARKLLDRIKNTQCEYQWIDKETELPCRMISEAEGTHIELQLKTAKNASQEAFIKDAYNFNYYFQKGMSYEGHKANGKDLDYNYLVIEKEEPYGINILKPTEDFINLGRQIFIETIREFKMCLNEGGFEMSYEFKSMTGYQEVDLPYWAKKELKPTNHKIYGDDDIAEAENN